MTNSRIALPVALLINEVMIFAPSRTTTAITIFLKEIDPWYHQAIQEFGLAYASTNQRVELAIGMAYALDFFELSALAYVHLIDLLKRAGAFDEQA
jgi:hypothetical protein